MSNKVVADIQLFRLLGDGSTVAYVKTGAKTKKIGNKTDFPQPLRKQLEEWFKGATDTTNNANVGILGDKSLELMQKLNIANENNDYVYLDEGVYKINSQIKLSMNNNPNVKGIIGKGKGVTIIEFNWAQEITWDANTNLTDARFESGILINETQDILLQDFTIRYTGEFYRPKESYFGCVSTIHINNSSNCTVERVEGYGGNRAGIYLGCTDSAIKENTEFYHGRLPYSQFKNHAVGNKIVNCDFHHNRVAGILIQNQVSPRIIANTCSYNGHEKDGGTGYGICAFSGSVNIDVVIENNTTDHNYRKGIDSHDAVQFICRNNTCIGDRFFGFAIESRGYPQERIVIEGNTIIQDPEFRLAVDDEHETWTNHRNADYYRHTAIRIENKSQPSQAWKNQPANVQLIIENNTIQNIDWDERGISRIIEIRNNEQAAHVKLNVSVKGNKISGKRVHNLFFLMGSAASSSGLGHCVIEDNTFDFQNVMDAPISLQEDNPSATSASVFEVKNNKFYLNDSNAWVTFFAAECSKRSLIKLNNNYIQYNKVSKQLIRIGRSDGLMQTEIMNNTIKADVTLQTMNGLFLNVTSTPANKVNLYENRLIGLSSEAIKVNGTTTSSNSIDSTNTINNPPKAAKFEDNYIKPTVKIPVPVADMMFNWDAATVDSVTSLDGTSTIVRAGEHPPANYGNFIEVNATPKYMKARLLNHSGTASAGVYPRMLIENTERIAVTIPIKIINLGARASTGVIIAGYGVQTGGTDTAGSGGFVARRASTDQTYVITKTNDIYVNGVPYKGEELTLGKTYVIHHQGVATATFINLGAPWNGNGQASADIFADIRTFKRNLNAQEVAAVSLDIMAKLGINGSSSQPTPALSQPTNANPLKFSMANASLSTNEVISDGKTAKLTAVKALAERPDYPDWQGLINRNGKKAMLTRTGSNVNSGRYSEITGFTVEASASACILFAFELEAGGFAPSSPVIAAMQDSALVAVGNVKLNDDGTSFSPTRTAGWTINNKPIDVLEVMPFGKIYIGMLKTTEKGFNRIRFGVNHILNTWKNIYVYEDVEILVNATDEQINKAYQAMKTKFNV